MIGKKTVVYTSGTFDMLHINHLRLIEYARGLGDILIVGVNTDELVASYKSTPMIPFEDRMALMRAIKGPDLVIPQHSLDHKEMGVTVVYTPYGRGTSSSSLKRRISERYAKMRKKSETLLPADAVEKARKRK